MIIRRATIMMIVLNASVAFLAAAGSGSVWGVTLNTGIDSTAESVQQSARNISGGPTGIIEAVAGLTVAALDTVTALLDIVFAAPQLFLNLGVPPFIVTFVFAPLYVVVAMDFVAIFRGDSGI